MVKVTIGIDLGSFYSRIAAVIDETVSVIEINDDRKLSSLVSLKSGTLLTGIKARNTASSNMIYDACRMQHEKKYSETWCFAKTLHGKCIIESKASSQTIIPQQDATAALLRSLIEAAERRLGAAVDKVVITIPDYIDHYFRCLILDAAKMAKINDVQLISQNTAAAITYIRGKPHTSSSTCFMIFNFGANQLSISVYENYGKHTKLIYSNCEEGIGGEDFTARLAEVFLGILKQKEGDNFVPGTKTLKYLREAAEKAKIDLSLMEQTECILEIVEEKRCHTIHFSRANFENFCQPLLKKVENCLNTTIENLKQNISEIIMVGGSSRIFAVKEFLKNRFPYASFNSTLVPEEAIVFGAAIKAEMLNKSSIGVGDISNTTNSSIYCETDFAKILLINSMEAFPNTPRCFSYFKEIPKIEFFQKGNQLRSLGYLENVPANSYFCCEFDNNGILKCFIDDKLATLKHEKEIFEIVAKKDSDSAIIDIPKNNDRESHTITNSLEEDPPLSLQNKPGYSDLEASTNTHNVPIKNEALINSFGSSNAPPPIPTHLKSSHNFVDTHAGGYGSSNANYDRPAPSDPNPRGVKINSSHSTSSKVEPQYFSSNSSGASSHSRTNDRTSSSASRSPPYSSSNNSESIKEKEKTYGKFPSETRL